MQKVKVIYTLDLLCKYENKMKWKYYIPHLWELEWQIWEDIYLLPLNGEPKQTIWLSLNSLQFIGEPDGKDERRNEWIKNILFQLSKKDYYIDEQIKGEMYVCLPNFTQPQLMKYTKLYLMELGYTVWDFTEGTYQDFEGEIDRSNEIVIGSYIRRKINENYIWKTRHRLIL